MRRVLAITLALFGVIYVVASIRYSPPAAVSRDAPRDRFSAERAREVQQRLVGDGATRYVGTEGNARARGVIVAELEKLGWTVETQRMMSCTYHGTCAPIANIIARLPGTDPDPSLPGVLVSAHYDSVPVSPGASDDGVGTTTVLETARALSEGSPGTPRPRRTVIVLLDDGEEGGLLGADAFVRNHPLARSVYATVNVDARGSHGPSQMFETSNGGNAWLISLVASHVDRPVTTSLFYEVYKRMPNDTDFTATKTIASGVNFANTAGLEHYHTPLDALDVADIRTLQHHGDHVLGMTRALAENKQSGGSREDAVWFDVLAFGIVRWPASWSLALALMALALVIGQAIRTRSSIDRGLAVFFATLVPGILVALVVGFVLRTLGAIPAPWIAYPLPGLVALHTAAATASVGIAFLLAARSTPRALWAGTWIGWGVLGVATAAFAPGISYLFIVPTMAAAVTGSLPPNIAFSVPATVAATLVLALATALYDALGFAVPPLVVVSTVLLATTLAPMLAGLDRFLTKGVPKVLGLVALVAAIVAIIVPKFSAANPQRVNVVFRQDDTSSPASARVFVDTTWGPATWGPPPDAMMSVLGIANGRARKEAALPWTLPTPFADVATIDAKPPLVEVLEAADVGGRRIVRTRLRSQRGAPTIAIVLPRTGGAGGRLVNVKVEGRTAIPRRGTDGSSMVGLLSVPAEGVVVEFDAAGVGPIPITILDRTYGVPAKTKAEDAVNARSKEATTFQDGDVTVITKAVSI